jgi:hypothetical protein
MPAHVISISGFLIESTLQEVWSLGMPFLSAGLLGDGSHISLHIAAGRRQVWDGRGRFAQECSVSGVRAGAVLLQARSARVPRLSSPPGSDPGKVSEDSPAGCLIHASLHYQKKQRPRLVIQNPRNSLEWRSTSDRTAAARARSTGVLLLVSILVASD